MDRPDDKDTLRQVQQSLSPNGSEALESKLASMLDGFRQDLAAHPYVRQHPSARPQRWSERLPLATSWRRPVLMISSGLAGIAIVMTILFLNRTPTWADVEKQFGAIDYCTISVYFRNLPFEKPTFAQYWLGRDGRARIHMDHFVIFIGQDTSIRSFNIKTRSSGYPYSAVKSIVRAMEGAKKQGTPTLRSIIEALAGEKIVDTTDLVISDAQVAKDLLVLDAPSHDTLWWFRMWVLRESQLPVRILKWHQKHDRFIDLQFTYSQEQLPVFFDPDAFAAGLQDPSIDYHRLMHRFLQDPGGQAFPTPGS